MWDDGKYRIHANVHRTNDVNISSDTIIKTRRVRKNTVYVGNPTLLDRLLGRAEKRKIGTNAEEFVRDVLEKASSRIEDIEKGRGGDLDRDAFMNEIEEQVFPLSSWADVEDSAREIEKQA